MLAIGVALTVIGAIGLAQIGEFSFLLMSEGFRDGLVSTETYQYLLATAILTMVAPAGTSSKTRWASS